MTSFGLPLSFGVDPNQRGINDFTRLHMAVAERNYRIRFRLWLNHGEAVRWRTAWG